MSNFLCSSISGAAVGDANFLLTPDNMTDVLLGDAVDIHCVPSVYTPGVINWTHIGKSTTNCSKCWKVFYILYKQLPFSFFFFFFTAVNAGAILSVCVCVHASYSSVKFYPGIYYDCKCWSNLLCTSVCVDVCVCVCVCIVYA